MGDMQYLLLCTDENAAPGSQHMSISGSNLLPKNAAGSQHHEHQRLQPFAKKRRGEPAS